jgi:hypothetical protein
MNATNCKNRIKPTFLREQKTEALLIFIRTTLEKYFKDVDDEKVKFQIGSKEDNDIIDEVLKTLLDNLKQTVVNSSYLRSITEVASKNQAMMMLAKKEEPVMVYYDAIIKQLENSLLQGQNWIPEQLTICLLSQWVLEEEKSTILYPFLNEINYIDILSRYDLVSIQAKKDKDWNKTLIVKTMYRVADDLIQRLKNTTYKVRQRVSKSRKKKRK